MLSYLISNAITYMINVYTFKVPPRCPKFKIVSVCLCNSTSCRWKLHNQETGEIWRSADISGTQGSVWDQLDVCSSRPVDAKIVKALAKQWPVIMTSYVTAILVRRLSCYNLGCFYTSTAATSWLRTIAASTWSVLSHVTFKNCLHRKLSGTWNLGQNFSGSWTITPLCRPPHILKTTFKDHETVEMQV